MVQYKNTYYNADKKRLFIKCCKPSEIDNLDLDLEIEEIIIWNLLIKKNEKINNLPFTLKMLKLNDIYLYDENQNVFFPFMYVSHKIDAMKNIKLPFGCNLKFMQKIKN